MKATVTKRPMIYMLLALCLGAAPAALAQTHFLFSSSDKSSDAPAWHTLFSPSCTSAQANVALPTPEELAARKQASALYVAASADQHAGRFAQAEAEARQGLAVDPMSANVVVLAMAMEAEGKTQEALQVYQSSLIVQDQQGLHQNGDGLFLPYAWLQLNSGHWAQAVAAYNAALPLVGDSLANVEARAKAAGPDGHIIQDGDVIRANSNFSLDAPEPDRLALMIHLARGIVDNTYTDGAYDTLNKEAFAEYGKALALAPNSALANYYYGVGWSKLSPAEQQQFGSIQQARAALTKAVRLAKGPLKVKAQKALLVAMKTK